MRLSLTSTQRSGDEIGASGGDEWGECEYSGPEHSSMLHLCPSLFAHDARPRQTHRVRGLVDTLYRSG